MAVNNEMGWATTDIGLATYLIIMGQRLITTKRAGDGRQMIFLFDATNRSTLRKFITEYACNDNLCRNFMDTLRYMKSLVHSNDLEGEEST